MDRIERKGIMKKVIPFFVVLLLCISISTTAWGQSYWRAFRDLTGGSTSALYRISGNSLGHGDRAIVALYNHATYGNMVLFYHLDAYSGATELMEN